MKQPKWILGTDGYHRNETNHDKGQSPFNKPIRTTRSTTIPVKSDGKPDWQQWDKNIQQERGDGS